MSTVHPDVSLEQIRLIETTATDNLYLAISSLSCLPGEYLKHQGHEISVLRCRKQGDDYQWLFQCPVDIKLATEATFELTGSAISYVPEEPVYVFAEDSDINKALHWIDYLRQELGNKQTRNLLRTVIFHQKDGFSFAPVPSTFILPELPTTMIAAVPLLEDLGIASRLCCDVFKPGCYEGNLIELMQETSWGESSQSWLGFVTEESAQAITRKLGAQINLN